MSRDKYGHFINDNGVEMRATEDKYGKSHIDVYNKCPADNPDHGSIHFDYDSASGKGKIVDTTNGEKETVDTQCYLTTACMKYFKDNFDDNCYELTVLRWFRDNFVSAEDINYYYEIAPYIVAAINKEENSKLIYDYIYDNVVDYCIEQIESGNYINAYNRYKNSVIVLEDNILKPLIINQQNKILKLKK